MKDYQVVLLVILMFIVALIGFIDTFDIVRKPTAATSNTTHNQQHPLINTDITVPVQVDTLRLIKCPCCDGTGTIPADITKEN